MLLPDLVNPLQGWRLAGTANPGCAARPWSTVWANEPAASVTTDGDFQGAVAGRRAAADFGLAAEDRGVEITGAALVADADRHIFQDHETAFVTQRFPLDAPRLDLAPTVFAGEIVHGLTAT